MDLKDWDTKQSTDLSTLGKEIEEINEDDYYYDPTLLTVQIDDDDDDENVMFKGGLGFLCKQQEFKGEPMHMALEDYDVVISVTKKQPKPPE